MNVPNEFKYFVSSFYQGSDRDVDTEEEWIQSRVNVLPAKSKIVVKQFLELLLAGEVLDSELQEAWKSGGSCFMFRDADIRKFLELIRDVLGR